MAVVAGATIAGCASHRRYDRYDRGREERREHGGVYDRSHRDYHAWNGSEERAYRRFLAERHREYRDFFRLRDQEQRDYWSWRHRHSDDDHDRR
jgi:hypothetical protein